MVALYGKTVALHRNVTCPRPTGRRPEPEDQAQLRNLNSGIPLHSSLTASVLTKTVMWPFNPFFAQKCKEHTLQRQGSTELKEAKEADISSDS